MLRRANPILPSKFARGRPAGFSIAVSVDKEHYTAVPVTHSPYVVEDGAILIFPGETLVFKLPVEGDKIGKPQFIAGSCPKAARWFVTRSFARPQI